MTKQVIVRRVAFEADIEMALTGYTRFGSLRNPDAPDNGAVAEYQNIEEMKLSGLRLTANVTDARNVAI